MMQNRIVNHQCQMMPTVSYINSFQLHSYRRVLIVNFHYDFSEVFLTEVIDSLERGYREKSNPDFLILEINSSRYAYNMSLSEVNFYVAKAMLSLYPIKECDGNVMGAFKQIYGHLNSVLKNYIRGADAMLDCLKAIEVIFCLFSASQFTAYNICFFLCSIKTIGKLSPMRNAKTEIGFNHTFSVRQRDHFRGQHSHVARRTGRWPDMDQDGGSEIGGVAKRVQRRGEQRWRRWWLSYAHFLIVNDLESNMLLLLMM